MKLKQFRPRLKTSIEHIANVFSRAPPEFPWIPFQKWFNISYTHNSHTRVFLLLLFFSLHRLQIHSWIPHHPPPTFKDSCGGMGGLQMVVFYGFTLFTNWFLAMWNKNRYLPPVEPPPARQKRVEKSVERGRTSSRKTNDSRRIVRRIYASHTCPRHS